MNRNNDTQSTELRIDRQQALEILALLGYQNGDMVYLRGFYPKGDPRISPKLEHKRDKGRKDQARYPNLPWQEMEDWQEDGRGVYFVVNGGGHSDKNVQFCRAIFYEHDDLPKEESRDLWQKLGFPEPTVQVDTGGKSIHSYWLFDEATVRDNWSKKTAPGRYTGIQADFLEYTKADKSLKNHSRVMRLAGGHHIKIGREPRPSRIISNSGKRYSYEKLRSLIPVVEHKAPKARKRQSKSINTTKNMTKTNDDYIDLRDCGNVLNDFDEHGREEYITSRCPVHGEGEDHSSDSLHIRKDDGRFKCHAGCQEQDIYIEVKKRLGLWEDNPVQDNQPKKSDRPTESKAASLIGTLLKNKLAYDRSTQSWRLYSRSIPGVWDKVSAEEATSIIQEKLESLPTLQTGFSASYVRGVQALLKRHLSVKRWNSKDTLIPFANGVFDTATNKFIGGHNPEHQLTWQLPRSYTPTVTEFPTIERWLNFVFSGDAATIHRFHCAMAAILKNRYREQIFIHFKGQPRAGKGTAVRLAQDLIGRSNAVSTNLSDMNVRQFETFRYIDKSLIVLPEQSDYRGDISVFLSITGNDTIRVEEKRQHPGDYLCRAIIMICSNGSVFLARTGAELTERQVLFTFDKPVPANKRDPSFNKKLAADLEAWTNHLLSIPDKEIHQVLHGLNSTTRITIEQWQIKTENDSIAGWTEENLVFSEGGSIQIGKAGCGDTFFGNYTQWCKDAGRSPVQRDKLSTEFMQLMSQVAPDIKIKKHRTNKGTVIQGVALRGNDSNAPSLSDILFPHKLKDV